MDNKKTIMELVASLLKETKRLQSLIAEDYRVDKGICPHCGELALNDVYMPLEGSCKGCYSRLADVKGQRANEMN